ncbi:efflux RND transporter periplasmic adaptor subunit [Roseimaritima sediminicola]|uniref:efflux RND transporter periplasmic adaptor subunit n=1 Tax=Roseimaritima sediminicola TaxID=2662066 RepID=UPI0012984EE9|nr:efflux RND transporter periplasmic adaptor subunit [Roseimaritima sediminicola]
MSAVPPLRTDLHICDPPRPPGSSRTSAAFRSGPRAREQVVHDPLSGTFTRIDRDQLDALRQSPADCDPQLLAAANAAGLLRCRRHTRGRGVRLGDLLAIRLPGISALPLARRAARYSGWLFSAPAVLCWSLVILLALLSVPVYWQRFQANLPGLQAFFSAANAPLLVGTLVATKALHELAHATVCFRCGARPGEIGIMLLCGAPCPYCDVTDSWRLPQRRQRMAIMLAGVYVELILAALALPLWWFTSAGTLHFAAMNVIVVCSLSTLLFNLNPLMRYDGYYVLADLCRSTNLRQEAADAFAAVVVRPLAGRHYHSFASLSWRNVGLAAFHTLSLGYRIVIAGVLAHWVLQLASGLSLRPLGIAVAVMLLAASPVLAGRRWLALLRGAAAWQHVPPRRRLVLGVLLGAGLVIGLLVPIPSYQLATGRVDVAGATAVYLPDAGRIGAVSADYGQRVAAGDPLVQLDNFAIQKQAVQTRGKRQTLAVHNTQLRRQAIDLPALLERWDSQQEMLNRLSVQEQTLQSRLRALHVVAPASGIVLPPDTPSPPARDNEAEQHDTALQCFADSTVRRRAQTSLHRASGSWARAGGRWCRIGDPERLVVLLDVDARHRGQIAVGDSLRVGCQPACGTVATLTVDSISTRNAATHRETGSQNRFQIACRVPKSVADQWPIGAPVEARLQAPARSLATRLAGWLDRLFHEAPK